MCLLLTRSLLPTLILSATERAWFNISLYFSREVLHVLRFSLFVGSERWVGAPEIPENQNNIVPGIVVKEIVAFSLIRFSPSDSPAAPKSITLISRTSLVSSHFLLSTVGGWRAHLFPFYGLHKMISASAELQDASGCFPIPFISAKVQLVEILPSHAAVF